MGDASEVILAGLGLLTSGWFLVSSKDGSFVQHVFAKSEDWLWEVSEGPVRPGLCSQQGQTVHRTQRSCGVGGGACTPWEWHRVILPCGSRDGADVDAGSVGQHGPW